MHQSKPQRGAGLRRRLPKYLHDCGLALTVIVLISASFLPYGASGATGSTSQSPTTGYSAPMPLVTGADYSLSNSAFTVTQVSGDGGNTVFAAELSKSDRQDTREGSLGDNLTIPAGETEAIFTSGPTQAPIDFSDVASRWWADQPDGTSVLIELRTSLDGQTWSDWQSTDQEDDIMPTDVVTETYGSLISVDQTVRINRYVQTRVTLETATPGISPTFHEITYTFINAGVTPNPPQPQVMEQGTPADIPKPLVVSRKDWGSPQGESSPRWTPTYKRVTHIIIHHTATSNKDTDFAARVRAIWYYHAQTRGWGDIGYNYLVDPNGVIYEGRSGGDDVEAGHAYPFNNGTMGVGMIGNFMTVAPTAAAQASLINLISWKASQRGIDPHAVEPITGYTDCGGTVTYNRPTIAGHRDYAGSACGQRFNTSTCPGDRLWDMLPQIRDAVVSEQPPLRANFLQHDTPGNIEPGATVDVHLIIHNSGSLTWAAKGQGSVSIGYRWMTPDNQPVKDGWQDLRTALPHDVAFAGNVTITAKLSAPTTPGHYAVIWDLLHDGQGWFSDTGSQPLRIDVVVGRNLSDKTAPTSQMLPLPVYSNNPELVIRWAGEDDPKGSGIASFDIQYRTAPDGQWTDWKMDTNQTQATFDGNNGFTYEFRSRARDAAGNVEDWPAKAGTYTAVDTLPPSLTITDPENGDFVTPGNLIVSGRTEPGTFVAVNDKRADEVNGVFTSTVDAAGRDYVIHITAADAAGNVSRLEITVQASARYKDVPATYPGIKAIEYLSDQGIVSGYPDGSFHPDAIVTRAQLAKMLVTTMQWSVIKPPEARFSDVPADSWMFPYVETAAARGIMSGADDGTFAPNLPVSRSGIILALKAAAGKRVIASGLLFSTLPPGYWAATCKTSVPPGSNSGPDGTPVYCGAMPATRAEVSLLVYDLKKVIEKLDSKSPSDDNGEQ